MGMKPRGSLELVKDMTIHRRADYLTKHTGIRVEVQDTPDGPRLVPAGLDQLSLTYEFWHVWLTGLIELERTGQADYDNCLDICIEEFD